MDENLSWRARFAKANINILNLTLVKTDHGTINRWFVEFTYHPKPGVFKWSKTYIDVLPEVKRNDEDPAKWEYEPVSVDDMAQTILDKVLELREELEA